MSQAPQRDEQELTEFLWQALETGDLPADLAQLEVETIYRLQFAIMERHLAAGRELGGWKSGAAPPPLREVFGGNPSAPLFADAFLDSGCKLSKGIPNLLLEVELGIVMGTALAGPGATPETARAAIAGVRPSFEIVGGAVPLPDGPDKFPGFLASGLGHYRVVSGTVLELPAGLADREVEVELCIDGRRVCDQIHPGGTHFEVLAGLANHLARFGRRLESGQGVITGAQIVHIPERTGRYEARMAGLGEVSFQLTT